MVGKRLITAALPYINNVPHLGHMVGSHLPADIFARYCRSRGYDTVFVGGTDESGSTTEIAAEQAGVNISRFSDRLYKEHKRIYSWFNISYDIFSRTSKPLHHRTTQEFFKRVYNNGYITEGKIKVFYSPKEDRFLPDRYVEGNCPKCGYEHAKGDQCESCGAVLNPEDLINPRSVLSKSEVELKETKHLFLRLDKLSSKLEAWIRSRKNWKHQVKATALGWIKEGLKPRCITRDLKHGVPVPLKGYEDKVFYVWFDAPIGYLSFTKEIREDWEAFWKGTEAKIYNFLGKDNIPFHTIFWPGMLIAHKEYRLPYQVVGLQFLNYEGGKFSKSRKQGVFCEKLPETDLNPDILRGYLVKILPETSDSEFKWEGFQKVVNSELVGNYGNFINRTISIIYRYLNGEIKRPSENILNKKDKNFVNLIREKVDIITGYMERNELRNSFNEVLSLSKEGNRYFQNNAPWKLVKENPERAKYVLYLCANLCRTLAIITFPYMPNSSKEIWKQLNLEEDLNTPGIWNSAVEFKIPDNHWVNEPKILFEKITEEKIKSLKATVSETTDVKELFA